MNRIEGEYRARTPKSAEAMRRAARSMPGGITRITSYHLPYPLVLDSGAGPRVTDADGNVYIDLLNNYTSLIHGHAWPPVAEALARAAGRYSAWPAATEPQIALAELLCERIPSVERVMFANSGSEAGILAAKAARAATGRPLLLMAQRGYHGSSPDLELHPEGSAQWSPRTLSAPYGDADAFERVLEGRGAEIAAVVLEPVQGSGGVIVPPEGFLRRVREAARRAGALFVADEVITFRLGEGGAQAEDLHPDLTMLGKIIGGGLPVGALGGRADVMEVFDPYSSRFSASQGGTFNGNALTCTAGLTAMRAYRAPDIAALDDTAARVESGLLDAATAAGLGLTTRRAGSLVQLVWPDAASGRAAHLSLLNHGVYTSSRGLLALSTVTTPAVADEAVGRAVAAFAALAGVSV